MQSASPLRLGLAAAASIAFGTAFANQASASSIEWVDWTAATHGAKTGSAVGTIAAAGVTVTYTGEVASPTTINGTYPSYGPASTFSGGTVGNAPFPHDIIAQSGGTATGTNTITFSSPVTNPVIAIWSLGQRGIVAQYDFSAPFTIESGGPSNEYGGKSITSVGNNVFGEEGNGTIQFLGTYSSISFTNPVFEFWYGFTLGVPASAVPEPASLGVLGLGLAGLSLVRRTRRA